MSAHERIDQSLEPYGFEDHEDLALSIGALRRRLLCDDLEEQAQSEPEAEQYHLLVLATLEQAERFAMLAEYKLRQMRARTKGSWP